MTSPRWRLPCLLAFAALAVGCWGRIPPTHYYVLELRGEGHEVNPGPAAGGLEIGVESFAVDPPYDQDRLIYRVGEGSVEIGFYHYHRWATPLSRMLPRVVAVGLRGTPGRDPNSLRKRWFGEGPATRKIAGPVQLWIAQSRRLIASWDRSHPDGRPSRGRGLGRRVSNELLHA